MDDKKSLKKLFVAIDVPFDVLQEMERLQQVFKQQHCMHATYPLSEHMHITLAFIGSVNNAQIPKIDAILQGIRFPAFKVLLGQLNFFGSPEFIKVIYAALYSPELIKLGMLVQHDLIAVQILPESKEDDSFIPHLTLARVKSVLDKEQLVKMINTIQPKPIPFLIDEFFLKESVHENGLLNHKTICTYKLPKTHI
ncbi:MAG: RNA 2',3'-cyclic phosphodiesterase [Candidatus Dependentiae bacterium]